MARPGGVNEPISNFNLVEQDIQVRATVGGSKSFHVRFPNVWDKYKLPKVIEKEVYDDWLSNQMQFWENQLNFAVWCATTGCGVSKEHLRHKDPMTKSVFRFHAYYQIRRILSEMSCPLPTEDSWNPLNNGINMNAYERICNEFGVSPRSNWRQRCDLSNGMESCFFYKKFYDWKLVTTKKWSELTNGGHYSQSMNWKVHFDGQAFGGVDTQTDDILYIKQLFDHDSGLTDRSIRHGNAVGAIGSFVLDTGYDSGFFRAGVSRINDSIRTYVWAILGSQSQARSSILGSGKAFDAQKQFIANVEDAINSEVDLPSSIDRYQRTLQYARSKVDFVIGHGLYMLPSNMEIEVGVVNGYNNLIQIATDDMQLGFNASVNELDSITSEDFETPSKPADQQSDPANKQTSTPAKQLNLADQQSDLTQQPSEATEPDQMLLNLETTGELATNETTLNQDERKLSLILGVAAVVFLASFFR